MADARKVKLNDIFRGDSESWIVRPDIKYLGWKLWFTMKQNQSDPDEDAVIQKTATFVADVDPALCLAMIYLAPGDTLVDYGTYYYDFQMTADDESENITWEFGTVNIVYATSDGRKLKLRKEPRGDSVIFAYKPPVQMLGWTFNVQIKQFSYSVSDIIEKNTLFITNPDGDTDYAYGKIIVSPDEADALLPVGNYYVICRYISDDGVSKKVFACGNLSIMEDITDAHS